MRHCQGSLKSIRCIHPLTYVELFLFLFLLSHVFFRFISFYFNFFNFFWTTAVMWLHVTFFSSLLGSPACGCFSSNCAGPHELRNLSVQRSAGLSSGADSAEGLELASAPQNQLMRGYVRFCSVLQPYIQIFGSVPLRCTERLSLFANRMKNHAYTCAFSLPL